MSLLRGTDWIFIYNLDQWLLYAPQGLTLKNSTFCPHTVFTCFVWISEQTAIISLYSINRLVFVTETECVYCAVRTESSNIMHVIRNPIRVIINLICFVTYKQFTICHSRQHFQWSSQLHLLRRPRSIVDNRPWTSLLDIHHPDSWHAPVAVTTVFSTPDDGRRKRPKHVQCYCSC